MDKFDDLLNVAKAGASAAPSPRPGFAQSAAPGGNVAAFVAEVGPTAAAVGERIGVDPAVLIGQWGLETGWGKSVIPGTNNLGNIKAFDGSGVAATDNMTGSHDRYRQYASYDGFGADYAGLIERRYRGAMGAGADAGRFGEALKAGGYAEDPDYAAKLARAADMVRGAGGGGTVGARQAAQPKARDNLGIPANPYSFADFDRREAEAAAARELEEGRTWGEVAGDVGLAVTGGAFGIAELVGTGVGLVTGDMDNVVRIGGEAVREWAQQNQSKVLQAHKKLRAMTIEGEETEAGKFFAYLSETLGSPALAVDFIAEQVPQLAVMGGVGRAAGAGAQALGLGARGANAVGTGAAIGAGSTMQGLDAASQAYSAIMAMPRGQQLQNRAVQQLIAEGVEEREAVERVARAEALTAGAMSAGISAAVNALPGAATLERALAGGAARGTSRVAGALKGAVGEGASEAIDEMGGVGAANLAAQQFNPEQSLTEGMGEAAAAGALFAPFGGVAGAMKAPPFQPKPNSPLANAAGAAAAMGGTAVPPAAAGAPAAAQSAPEGEPADAAAAGAPAAAQSAPEGEPADAAAADASLAANEGDPRLAAVQSFIEDKTFLQALRTTEGFGKESVSELLAAYAKARNPNVDPLIRERALTDIERFIETFNNRPNFTMGGERSAVSPGAEVVPVAESPQQAQPPALEAPAFSERDITPQPETPAAPAGALVSPDVLQAKRDADAAYDQAFQDLLKAEQPGAADGEILAYQQALDEARAARNEMDARLQEVEKAIAAGRAERSRAVRRAVLDEVLADPETVNPAERFAAELQRQGFREATPTADELATIERFQAIKAAEPAPEVEPAAPNEMPADLVPERIEPEPAPATPATPRERIAEVQRLVGEGWRPGNGRELVSPAGKRRNLNVPELAAARDAYRKLKERASAKEADRQATPDRAAPDVSGQPEPKARAVDAPAADSVVRPETSPEVVADAAQPAQVAEEAPAASGQEGAPASQGVAVSAERPQDPGVVAIHDALAEAEANTNATPTNGQKEAGNYAKGKVDLHGQRISIETPKGAERSGIGEDGERWAVTMPASYGYVLGTLANDGDHVDVFIGPKPEAGMFWVVNQVKPDSATYDEPKVMLGFETAADAHQTYLQSFSGDFGPRVFGGMVGPFSVAGLDGLLPKMERNRPVRGEVAIAGRLQAAQAPDTVAPQSADTEPEASQAGSAGAEQATLAFQFEEHPTALVIIGDRADIKAKLDAAGVGSIPRRDGVVVPNRVMWDRAREALAEPASAPTRQADLQAALQILLDRTDGNGSPDGLSGPEYAEARTAIVSALTGRPAAELQADSRHRFITSVAEVERLLYDAAGVTGDSLPARRAAFLDWLDERTGQQAPQGEAAAEDVSDADDAPSLLRDADPNPSAVDGVVRREEADAFLADFLSRFPGAPEIVALNTFDQLPAAVQASANQQNSDERSTKGVFHRGKVYLVVGNHASMADFEATVFHETLGHAGVRAMFGQAFVQKLNQVYIGLGGQGGLVKIMNRRGMGDTMQRYIRGVLQAQQFDADAFRQAVAAGDPAARRVWTDAMAKAVLTEEVFAHIAEQLKDRPGLRDRFLELVGRVRQWLRDNGFARLAELNEADMLFLLSRARESMRGQDGDHTTRTGVTVTESEVFTPDGKRLNKNDPDFAAAMRLADLLGLREEPGVTVFSIRPDSPPIVRDNQRNSLFTALAKFEGAFQQPTPQAKTVEEIAREIDPAYRAKAMPEMLARDKTKDRAHKMWEISVPKSNVRVGHLFEDPRGRVWIDVSRLIPDVDTGNKIYGIAAGYAHNTGKVFIGDPEGLSPVAFFRRLENMISSALRFGTVDHIYPHAAQVDPAGYYGEQYPDFAQQVEGLGLNWKEGDFAHNLTEMLRVSYNSAVRYAPKIKDIVYDFDSRQFVDAASGERRDRRGFRELLGGDGPEAPTRYRGGSATLARAALVNTLLRGQGTAQWRQVLDHVGAQLRGRGLDLELQDIFYQRRPDAPTGGLTPEQFRAALVKHFGEAGIQSLESQGLLNIAQSDDLGTPAWYEPGEGRAYFDPALIRDARHAVEAVYHEIGEHHGLRAMLGEEGWRSLKARVSFAAKGGGSIGTAWRAVMADYPEFADLARANYATAAENERFMHEVIAKIGEDAAGRANNPIWAFIKDQVRAFLRSIGLAGEITTDEVAALVDGSLRKVMRGALDVQPRADERMAQRRDAANLADYAESQEGRRAIRERIGQVFDAVLRGNSVKTFNWWNRTIGSQYHKAKKSPEFRRVYDRAHAFIDDVSRFANQAADRAKNILPHLDTWKDIGAGLNVRKSWADAKDYQAIAPAIFEGTLANGTTGKVWTDEELSERFGLNEKQIGLYREFRNAVDYSLETLAASEMARSARVAGLDAADPGLGMDEAQAFYMAQIDAMGKEQKDAIDALRAQHDDEREMAKKLSGFPQAPGSGEALSVLGERQRVEMERAMADLGPRQADIAALRQTFSDKADQIRRLQVEGYAPLMRFGQYTIDVVRVDEGGNPVLNEAGDPDRPFFGMFESSAEAREAEKILREEYPDYKVESGIMAENANELYRGITPETAELFGRLLGATQEEAFQAYLKQAVANRSAMKRLIERKGMEGFSQDVPRVLASFITSNARLASGNLHFGEMAKAVVDIPKAKGDVATEAIKLMNYIQNPQEEAAGLRGFLFFSFLGGSVAAALVNTTQTLSTTLPYLHQFGSKHAAGAIGKAMTAAAKAMGKNGIDGIADDGLRAAMQRASEDGIIDPQEIHLLMAESMGGSASSLVGRAAGAINKQLQTPANRVARSFTQAWGSLFSIAEKYNRHIAFMAAWEVAGKMSTEQLRAAGAKDRYDFARNAVIETQFDYTKASRPNWARGAVGATLFTFKTFMISYLEFLARLPSRERAIAIAALLLLSGLSGAPGVDDLDDVIDAIGQKFGYNWNNAAGRHAWLVKMLGDGGANFVEHGVSSLLPIDVSARLGMGNIIPGTEALKKSSTDKSRDAVELLGPAGSVASGAFQLLDQIGSGKDFDELIKPVAPKAYNDMWQALDILQTGYYRDRKGRKVVEADAFDALMKATGFQPNAVAEPRRVEWMIGQSAQMQRAIRSDIYELWSRGVFEKDAQKTATARAMALDWNRKNPDTPIRINPDSIAQRVKAMRSSSAERMVKATPREMRNMIRDELAVTD